MTNCEVFKIPTEIIQEIDIIGFLTRQEIATSHLMTKICEIN